MIKKILYILGFLMFASAVAQPILAIGAEPPKQFSGDEKDIPFSSARLFSKLVDKIAGVSADTELGQGGDTDTDIGQNIYMIIYNKTQNQPIKNALKNVAGRYGMSEGEMNMILNGDYTKLLDKKTGLTQAEMYNKVAEMKQLYKEQKDTLELEANIKAATAPSEIYANGDTGDSEFDLIDDLSVIEKILFLKSNPIDVGKGYNSASDNSGEIALPTPPAPGAPAQSPNDGGVVIPPGAATPQGKPGIAASPVTPATPSTPPLSGKSSGGALSNAGVNPNSCFSNPQFMDALKNFQIKASIDPNYKDRAQVLSANTSAKTPAVAGTGTNQSGLELAKDDFFPVKPIPPAPPVQPAPADNWKGDNLCNDIFCLTINFIKKPAVSSFKNSDNCISCHAEKINDILKKVINSTLSPSKAPGNLFESAKCKKALGDSFSKVSMNFYAIQVPVKTPINDDIAYGTNIEDDWYNYCNAVSFPFPCAKKDPPKTVGGSQYTIPPSATDTVTGKVFSNTSDSTSQADVSRDIQIGLDSYSLQRSTDLNAYEAGKGSDKALGFYNPLKVELNNMNAYFGNIRDILHSLHEKVSTIAGGQACTDLNNKKECS